VKKVEVGFFYVCVMKLVWSELILSPKDQAVLSRERGVVGALREKSKDGRVGWEKKKAAGYETVRALRFRSVVSFREIRKGTLRSEKTATANLKRKCLDKRTRSGGASD